MASGLDRTENSVYKVTLEGKDLCRLADHSLSWRVRVATQGRKQEAGTEAESLINMIGFLLLLFYITLDHLPKSDSAPNN